MSLKTRPLANYLMRMYSQVSGSVPPAASHTSAPAGPNTSVPGLTEACVKKPTGQVGPGVDPNKGGEYKVPEYFCYNTMSYYEAEIEMAKHRLPQPSANKK